MAYRRRYLSGQSATTVVIAEGAITTDKIVDKAVTQPKVADDAITSDKIAAGAVESSEIKDGEVKTADIAPGAVVTSKIADGAVTTQKLEASIQGIARPLTPGVSSDEIAAGAVVASKIGAEAVETAKIKDGGVNAVKLAADAIEEVKIKDGAVSAAKIAGGAVTETKIGANAVTGSKIADGVVSVTELADNAVETAKIKDLNVTTEKIENLGIETGKIAANAVTATKLDAAALVRRHIESLNVREAVFHDSCIGPPHGGLWINEGDAGGVVDEYEQGRRLYTKTTTGSKQRIRLKGAMGVWTLLETLPSLNVGIGQDTGKLQAAQFVGFYKDATNYVAFTSNSDDEAPARWKAKAIKGGVSSVVDTGIEVGPAVGLVQILLIEFQSDGSIKYFINGAEVAHITDVQYIPDEKYEIRLEVEARANVDATMIARFIDLYEKRQGE